MKSAHSDLSHARQIASLSTSLKSAYERGRRAYRIGKPWPEATGKDPYDLTPAEDAFLSGYFDELREDELRGN